MGNSLNLLSNKFKTAFQSNPISGSKPLLATSSTSSSTSTSTKVTNSPLPPSGPRQAAALAALKRSNQPVPSPSTNSSVAPIQRIPSKSTQVNAQPKAQTSSKTDEVGLSGGLQKMWGMMGGSSTVDK